MERPKDSSEQTEEACCRCPFCDQAMEMPYPFCRACGAELSFCQTCGQPLPQDAESCTHCSEEEG
jgi:predicted amidophosphoribosyltransferase